MRNAGLYPRNTSNHAYGVGELSDGGRVRLFSGRNESIVWSYARRPLIPWRSWGEDDKPDLRGVALYAPWGSEEEEEFRDMADAGL